jgi:hypothetical protein
MLSRQFQAAESESWADLDLGNADAGGASVGRDSAGRTTERSPFRAAT